MPKYREIGAYKDKKSQRALRFGPGADGGKGHTAESCMAKCPQYKYFALQYGGQCFCDNDFQHATKYGKHIPACSKDGGPWCNYIYKVNDEDKTEDNNKGKKKNTVIVIVVVAVLALGLYVAVKMKNKKK